MRYAIEYKDGHHSFIEGSKDLIGKLETSKRDEIKDVFKFRKSKFYRGGISETVLDIYGKYIGKKVAR